MADTVRTTTLRAAASILGGPRKLRDFLRAPTAEVLAWLAGVAEPPQEVFLKAVTVVLDDLDARESAGVPRPPPDQGSPD
jgi:hypothetical protein